MYKMKETTKTTMWEIYKYVKEYTIGHLYPPTTLEIAAKFNMKSIAGVQNYLRYLERLGKIKLGKGARTIRLVGYKLVKEDENEH